MKIEIFGLATQSQGAERAGKIRLASGSLRASVAHIKYKKVHHNLIPR